MKAHTASLVNALALVALGAWGYFASETPSPTALIPVVGGALLLLLNPGVKRENKVVAHVAVALTLILALGLVMPLRGALGRGDVPALLRVSGMLATTVLALVAFIGSFRAARRARAASG